MSTMDPNATLKEMLKLSEVLIRDQPDKMDSSAAHSAISDGQRLAELVTAMHRWIERGGFLPETWEGGHGIKLDVEVLNADTFVSMLNTLKLVVVGTKRIGDKVRLNIVPKP